MDNPIPRWRDLYIGSNHRRDFQVRQNNAAVNITGWSFKADLLLSPDQAATPLLALVASDFAILAPTTGDVRITFPTLTETNTGGRDQNRIFRLKAWLPGDVLTGPPREQLDFVVAVR